MTTTTGPDPAGIIASYDMWDPNHVKQKWDVFTYARNHCPVARTDTPDDGQYVVTRYEDVRRILEDHEPFPRPELPLGPPPSN